ncbi:MAG: cobyrinate a,c-diamide synthase [Pseudomonadota bacterium]
MEEPGRGLLLAAPSSGSGKTVITLGLLRAFKRRGVPIRGAKSGPDYIDPRFHEAASGVPCMNLDAWAMPEAQIKRLASGPGTLLIEGAMGLFDGAPPDGRGAAADLAAMLSLPVVLIVDARSMSQSIAPLVAGFARHDPRVRVAGVILNKVGSPRHEKMLRRALKPLDIPVLGAIPRHAPVDLPSRHLGLVQAEEQSSLADFLDIAADLMSNHVDLNALLNLTEPLPSTDNVTPARPPARTIAIAHDRAFAFRYPHMLQDWRAAGATLRFFSPLANAAAPDADLIYLPGGYPELHAGTLAAADNFLGSLRNAARNGTEIYGECGGYMVLGDGLIDADGKPHAMAGLLRLETSFANRKLHLGYRALEGQAGPFTGPWAGHEFHYATTVKAQGEPLFFARDAEGDRLPPMGLRQGSVSGSFAHVIARAQ